MRLLRADDFYFPEKVRFINSRIRQGEAITDATIEWAERIGIFPPNPASRQHFRAIACGAFASLGWPDASPEYLQIISDAVCAAFVIDDICDGDVASDIHSDIHPELSGSPQVFDRIATFWSSGDPRLLRRDLPLHIAFRHLRNRVLRCGVSRSWIDRFAESFHGWLAGIDAELQHKRLREIPPPDDLMEIRPLSGAAFVFMHFIELARGIELSDKALSHEGIIELNRLASRMAIYPNEVWSYKKESEHGHAINLVASLMHHRGMPLPEATAAVAEMHNVDMLRFCEIAQSTMASPLADASWQSYVTGLHHFIHGLFVWGWHAQRYSKDFFHAETVPTSHRATISHQRLRTFPAMLLDFSGQKKR